MLIAHLPAGYLLTRALRRPSTSRAAVWAGYLGSIFPDVDLLWFYLIDNRQHLHHRYWSHLPIYWLGIWLALFILARARLSRWRPLGHLFCANVMLHLVLDSISGGIFWLYPWSHHFLVLVEVPTRHDCWITNFLLHWTFLVELLLVLVALVLAGISPVRPTLETVSSPTS